MKEVRFWSFSLPQGHVVEIYGESALIVEVG